MWLISWTDTSYAQKTINFQALGALFFNTYVDFGAAENSQCLRLGQQKPFFCFVNSSPVPFHCLSVCVEAIEMYRRIWENLHFWRWKEFVLYMRPLNLHRLNQTIPCCFPFSFYSFSFLFCFIFTKYIQKCLTFKK